LSIVYTRTPTYPRDYESPTVSRDIGRYISLALILAPLGPPPDEAKYLDQAAAKAALQAYGRAHGYSILVKSSQL
jgi:hypothetical protein